MHNFPSPHTDFLTQYIDYRVPVDMFAELGRYDGSCLVDRTTGEAAARCDSEAANFLTLNLMHDMSPAKRASKLRARSMPRTWWPSRWVAPLRTASGFSSTFPGAAPRIRTRR